MQGFEGKILCFASRVFKEHMRENGFELVEEVCIIFHSVAFPN